MNEPPELLAPFAHVERCPSCEAETWRITYDEATDRHRVNCAACGHFCAIKRLSDLD